MDLVIGNSTYHVDRILICFVMQFCWTMLVNIDSIMRFKGKKEVFVMTGISLVPVPIILALFGDFIGVAMFVIPAAIACGVVLKARQWVGFRFTMATVGCMCVFLMGLMLIAYKVNNINLLVLSAIVLAILPAGLLSDAAFRQRVEELPRRFFRSSDRYDDGSCRSGDDGGCDFGRSGSGF